MNDENPIAPDGTFGHYSRAELEQMLASAEAIVGGFYFQAVTLKPSQLHQFVEFAGFMREWLKLCREGLEAGHDFTGYSPIARATMKGHHARYLGEKFGCLYQSMFAGRFDLIRKFCEEAFGVKLGEASLEPPSITAEELAEIDRILAEFFDPKKDDSYVERIGAMAIELRALRRSAESQIRTIEALRGALDALKLSGEDAKGRALCPKTDHASEDDDDTDIIIAGRQVPFVQVGMIVHPDDCLNCERDGSPLWCSALVCDIHDDDETARFGMMATLLFRNGERREEPCDELRRRWRLARDFDQARVYTGRWGAIPRGSVWPVAEVNEDA